MFVRCTPDRIDPIQGSQCNPGGLEAEADVGDRDGYGFARAEWSVSPVDPTDQAETTSAAREAYTIAQAASLEVPEYQAKRRKQQALQAPQPSIICAYCSA